MLKSGGLNYVNVFIVQDNADLVINVHSYIISQITTLMYLFIYIYSYIYIYIVRN